MAKTKKQSAQDILLKLLSTIENTGGLIRYEDGGYAPACDPDWDDLGLAAYAAYSFLRAARRRPKLTITDNVDFLVKKAAEEENEVEN
jgi:hypothetical protein